MIFSFPVLDDLAQIGIGTLPFHFRSRVVKAFLEVNLSTSCSKIRFSFFRCVSSNMWCFSGKENFSMLQGCK